MGAEWLRQLMGYGLAVAVITFQISAAFITQEIQVSLNYAQPLFLNWIGTSFMMSAGVIHVVYAAVLVYKDAQTPSFEHSNALEEGLEEEDEDRDDCDSMPSRMVAVPRLTIGSFPMRVLRKAVLMIEASTHLPIKRVVLLALPFCVLWFLANFLFTAALGLTSVASGMSLEQSTTIFVFVLSYFILREQVTLCKVAAVSMCIFGVLCIALADSEASSSGDTESDGGAFWGAFAGDLMVLGSSCGMDCHSLSSRAVTTPYSIHPPCNFALAVTLLLPALAAAGYMVLYKKLLGTAEAGTSTVNALLMLIGFWNTLLFWPLLVIADLSGWEEFAWPSWTVLALIVASGIGSLGFNYTLNWGIILMSPLFMRVAVVCGVPASFAVDLILHGPDSEVWLRVVGALVILAGFATFVTATHHEQRADIQEDTEKDERSGA